MFYLNVYFEMYYFIALLLLREIGCMNNMCLVKSFQFLFMVIFRACIMLNLHITLN